MFLFKNDGWAIFVAEGDWEGLRRAISKFILPPCAGATDSKTQSRHSN